MKTTFTLWFVSALLLLGASQTHAQPNLVTNYGFENASTVTGWITSNHAGTSSITTSNMRTGSRAYSNATNTTSTTGFVVNDASISVPNNQYLIIIAYYRVSGSQSTSRVQIGISGNMGSASTPAANNTYYRLTRSIQNTTGSTQNWAVRLNNYVTSGSSRTFIWDDVIAYVSSNATADVTAPNALSALNVNYTSGSAALTWTNGTDNSGGSGIARSVVLRQTSSTCPLTAPTLAANTVYSASGGYGVSAVGSWTVLDTVTGSATSYTDNTVASATNYVYAVIHEDFGYNHSTALLEYIPLRVSATPNPANSATGVSLTATLSWAATCGADAYDVYLSTVQNDVINEVVSARVSLNQTATSFTPSGALEATSVYYWKVVPKNTMNNGATGCTTWSFTTTTPNLGFTPTRSTGISYQSIISTGNIVPWGTSYNADDQMSDLINLSSLGFTGFKYQGKTVTGFKVNTNGFITFNSSSSASYTNSFNSQTLMIAPFWEDLVCQGYSFSQSQAQQKTSLENSVRYLITGPQGNQVLTVEWFEMEIFNNPGPSINFQLKLYEQDDRIEFIYDRMYGFNGTVNYTYSYSIGVSGTTVANPPTAGQAFIQQLSNVLSFSNTNTTNISELPDCNTMLTLTPSTSTSSSASARSISNNECSGAIDLAIQNGIQNNFCQVYSSKSATASSSITACSAATPGTPDDDVWFKFTVTSAGNYGITVNSSGSYNGVIQLFSGNCSSLTAINCVNATGNGLIETLTANSLVEGTYFIRVYDANTGSGGSGNFVISVYNILPPLVNDDCSGATALTIGATIASGSTSNATASAGISACTASVPGTPDDDVWYSFVATSTVTRVYVNGGSTYNAIVQLFSGTCGSLTNLACVSTTGAAGQESIDFATVIGTTYLVRVYHSANGATPTTGFNIRVENKVPDCPTLLTPVTGTSNLDRTVAQNLTWSAVTTPSVGTITYSVQVSTRADFSSLISLTGSTNLTATTYTIPANTLSAGTFYYWRIIATNVNGSSSGCSSFNFATTGTAPSCSNPSSPSDNATWQSISATTLTWSAGSGSPTGYDVYLGTNSSLVNSLDVSTLVSANQAGTTYSASGLVNNTTYHWVVIPKNGSGNASGCYVNRFTTIPAAPSNNDCASATSISATSSTAVSGTTLNATQSQSGSIGDANDDVWYTFVAARTTHNISVDPSSTFNAVIELFSGTCGSLVSVATSNTSGIGGDENLSLTTLTIGQTYYIRIYDFGSTTPADPTFGIRINDVDLGISSFVSPTANNCGATTVTVNVYNYSATAIDFSANNTTVNGYVVDPSNVTTNFGSVVLSSGTLASGASQQVTLTTSYNIVNAGSYVYTASITNANDNNATNNSLTSTLQTITLPSPFILSGTGSYCAGGSGVTFTLSGSQTGTNYQLFRSSVAASSVVAGSGSSINFTNVTVDGSYRVIATNTTTGCNSHMSASAVVTVNPLWLGITSEWNNTANWCDNVIPPTNANIIISGSAVNMPVLPGNVVVNNLELTESNKRIDLNGSTLTVNGAISGSGVVRGSNTSSMIINGSGNMGSLRLDQTTPGTTNRLQNLTINIGTTSTSDSLQLANSVSIGGTLTLNNGLLITNNNLTLISNSTGTARVATIAATADIRGNVTSQRYVPAITRRYRGLSPNTASFTYNDIKDDVFITGTGGATNGFDASPANSASVFTYQESTSGGRGWKAVTNINQSLNAGQGAIVFVRGDRTLSAPGWHTPPFTAQNEVTIDFVGSINKGNVSPTITYTNSGDATADGWNLVGNPYPSQIDWSLVTKSNLNSFVYILNPSTNGYQAASGSVIIASGQSFFVQANAASPSITFTESCKTSSSGTSYFKTSVAPFTIQMVQDSITSDIAWLKFESGASNNFLSSEDALKFTNSTINMGFKANNRAIQINTVAPLTNVADTFTLFANASSRSYLLAFSNFNSIPLTKTVLLRDLYTNKVTDLRATNKYDFTIDANALSQGDRFQLIFIDNSALPVEFIAVNAKRNNSDVLVTWSTATEKNNEKFIIERSLQEGEFEPIGVVKGALNSNIKMNYSFNDFAAIQLADKVGADKIYYRIRQVDLSGKSELSDVVVVNIDAVKLDNAIALYPNPANAYVNINCNKNYSLGLVSIFDITGKIVMEKEVTDSHELLIDLNGFNKGIYFVKTNDGNTRKLVIE
ncbi:MAG: T9SS C-terminal target domain-containing protein [Bacteroidetes bacterium]|nr:MAG: T9SS C-terminal target domain-containing protein [Bacteroidota bacterium]